MRLYFPALGRIKEAADAHGRIHDKTAGLNPCRFELSLEKVVDQVDRVLHVGKKAADARPRRTWNYLAIALPPWFHDPHIKLVIKVKEGAVHRLQGVLDFRWRVGVFALGGKGVPERFLFL